MSKFIFLIAVISISAAGGFFIGRQTKSAANAETAIPANVKKSEAAISADTKKPDFLKILQSENIINFQSWENDEKIFGVIRELNEPCDKDYVSRSCQKFSIYNEAGKVLYELKDIGINSISFSHFKPNTSHLIIETNGGGTDEFLKIIELANGKFTELDVSDETQLRGGWWTMPEYRSGVTGAYFKPAQLIVIQQIGGADDRPQASIFRLKENKLQKVGEIEMREPGDFIEEQLAKNSKPPQKSGKEF